MRLGMTAGSCSTVTTEVTMFGDTHRMLPGKFSFMSCLMAETQVGQCILDTINELVHTSSAWLWPWPFPSTLNLLGLRNEAMATGSVVQRCRIIGCDGVGAGVTAVEDEMELARSGSV